MKKLLFLFTFAMIITACGGPKFDQQAAFDEVMDLHDEAMPKIGEVMSLKKQLEAKAKAESDSTEAANLNQLAKDLGDAQEGMMVWMRAWAGGFEPHKKGETTVEEQKAFFASEKEKVTQVRDDINESISAAKAKLK